MSSINWNTFKEINSFDPNKYGGLKDMGLYINFHDSGYGNGGYNNNAIYKGISSIKFCNAQIANELLELAKNKYNSFIELLKDIPNKKKYF